MVHRETSGLGCTRKSTRHQRGLIDKTAVEPDAAADEAAQNKTDKQSAKKKKENKNKTSHYYYYYYYSVSTKKGPPFIFPITLSKINRF